MWNVSLLHVLLVFFCLNGGGVISRKISGAYPPYLCMAKTAQYGVFYLSTCLYGKNTCLYGIARKRYLKGTLIANTYKNFGCSAMSVL